MKEKTCLWKLLSLPTWLDLEHLGVGEVHRWLCLWRLNPERKGSVLYVGGTILRVRPGWNENMKGECYEITHISLPASWLSMMWTELPLLAHHDRLNEPFERMPEITFSPSIISVGGFGHSNVKSNWRSSVIAVTKLDNVVLWPLELVSRRGLEKNTIIIKIAWSWHWDRHFGSPSNICGNLICDITNWMGKRSFLINGTGIAVWKENKTGLFINSQNQNKFQKISEIQMEKNSPDVLEGENMI